MADWTNRRVSEHAVQWFAHRPPRLLVLAAGDLFIVDSEKGTPRRSLTQLTMRAIRISRQITFTIRSAALTIFTWSM